MKAAKEHPYYVKWKEWNTSTFASRLYFEEFSIGQRYWKQVKKVYSEDPPPVSSSYRSIKLKVGFG
jgi:hypothetical protein